MTVTVEVKHIDAGRPFSMRYCPVALALSEATGEAWRVSPVFPDVTAMAGNDAWRAERSYAWRSIDSSMYGRRVELPGDVHDRIQRYDAGCMMEPFSFEFSSHEL